MQPLKLLIIDSLKKLFFKKGVDYEFFFKSQIMMLFMETKQQKSNTYSFRQKTKEEYVQEQLDEQKRNN